MWHVPVDHDIFKGITTPQWLWYFYNFLEDRDESYKQRRNMVEYHASFIEPEAVRKIREAREKAIEIPDEEFSAGLKKFFGRELTAKRRPKGENKIEAVDPRQAIANYNAQQAFKDVNIDKAGRDYKHWLNSDLET